MVLNKKGAEWKLKRGRAQEDSFLEVLALEAEVFFFFFSTKDSKMKNIVHLLGMLPGVARKNV